MGGRGATSNLTRLRNYGTEFRQVTIGKNGKRLHTEDKRIMFVESTGKNAKTPYESMMPHRIYVLLKEKRGDKEIKSISFMDKRGFAYKFIDIHQVHKGIGKGKLGHTHMGYNRKEPREMNRSERKFVQKVLSAFYGVNRKRRKGGITKWLRSTSNSPHGKA